MKSHRKAIISSIVALTFGASAFAEKEKVQEKHIPGPDLDQGDKILM